MRTKIFLALAALAAAFPAIALQPSPAVAQAMASPDPMMSIDCTKAGDMMSMSGKMDNPPMTGDVDKDFVAMGMVHEKSMMMLMQVEMKCGKDPKIKAAVAKSMRESEQRLQMFHDQSQS